MAELGHLGGKRAESARVRRAEQLRRWRGSETEQEPAERQPRTRRGAPRVRFEDGAVFLAACSSGDTDEVKRLLARGADINTANVDGLTALHQVPRGAAGLRVPGPVRPSARPSGRPPLEPGLRRPGPPPGGAGSRRARVWISLHLLGCHGYWRLGRGGLAAIPAPGHRSLWAVSVACRESSPCSCGTEISIGARPVRLSG